ncbi:MAG: sodium:solute symporter [Bacteroidota bacterium]
MSTLDFFVLFGTLSFIVTYGIWKTRDNSGLESYLKGDSTMKWGTIGLSVMATQASAITFLSTPGQAYESGMGFVQNYFGLPLALIIVAAVFIPIYYNLRVYTAYEFLEKRFDFKTRILGALLFLVQRGLAAGITIYAPAIILSSILGWSLNGTILLVGLLVIVYTVTGGTRAVSITQKFQMGVIMLGMFTAFFMLIDQFPEYVSFNDALGLAGKLGKLEVVDFSFDTTKRYTFWSGITGGMFLALSYFGTDQSQVQRYLTGKNIMESKMGLMFNAVLKIPMQFFILLVGVMVFVFYQFMEPPAYFKTPVEERVLLTEEKEHYLELKDQFSENFAQKRLAIEGYLANKNESTLEEVRSKDERASQIRSEMKETILRADPSLEVKDSDYVFITFIMDYLPKGVIGLLIAVIFSAAMSSTAGELSALGSTTTVDFYQRIIKKEASEKHYLIASKALTALWGTIAVGFALFAHLVENLIEAVNILGSIFYGTILGIFLAAFFIKRIKGSAIFWAAVISEGVVILMFNFTEVGYLWYNVIGCFLTIILGLILQLIFGKK